MSVVRHDVVVQMVLVVMPSHTSRYMAILGMLEMFWDVLGLLKVRRLERSLKAPGPTFPTRRKRSNSMDGSRCVVNLLELMTRLSDPSMPTPPTSI